GEAGPGEAVEEELAGRAGRGDGQVEQFRGRGSGHVAGSVRVMSALPVDLRSDTVTRPTEEMRRAMAGAEVGDDVYREDPTVNALEERYAGLVGKDAAIYVPSGTMANQLALRCLADAGTSVIAGRRQHVVVYENGA